MSLSLCHIFTYQRRIARVSMKIAIRRGLIRILFKRRMYHVRVTYLLRSCGVSVTYLYKYGISLSYVRRIKVYVLSTCDVCVAYEAYGCRIYDVCTTFHFYLRRICSVPIAFYRICL